MYTVHSRTWTSLLKTAFNNVDAKFILPGSVNNFKCRRCSRQSCAPTNWWSAAALGGLLTGGGGGVGGVRPDKRTLKQRTRWTGVFPGFTGVSHFTCDLCWAAGAEKLTVNMHVVHNFTVDELIVQCLISGGS